MDITNEITIAAQELRNNYPSLRKGQALYNAAYKRFPHYLNTMPPECDCFYDDNKIDKFIDFLNNYIK